MSKAVVVDGSVAAAWFLPDERSEDSERLLRMVVRRELRAVVPELWHYEVLNALRTAVLRGRMTASQASLGAEEVRGLPVETVSAQSQGHAGILSAAIDLGLSAYDAAYLDLAMARGVGLVTADRRVLRLKSRFPWIRSLEEFLAREDAEEPEAEGDGAG